MRINVYSQELTSEVGLVQKTDERGNVHYGVRIFFAGSPLLHHTVYDDDRSAITYWIPHSGRMAQGELAMVFMAAARAAMLAPRPEKVAQDQPDPQGQ